MRRALKLLGIVVALVLFLLVVTCAPTTYVPLTTYPAPETRQVVTVVFLDSIRPQMVAVMDSVRPGLPEVARCLYGGIRKLPTHQVLEIANLASGDVSEHSDTTVIFECASVVNTLQLVGDLHSHPMVVLPEQPCIPSHTDFLSMLDDPRILVFYILCSNGAGYSEFRDGRWTWFLWRQR